MSPVQSELVRSLHRLASAVHIDVHAVHVGMLVAVLLSVIFNLHRVRACKAGRPRGDASSKTRDRKHRLVIQNSEIVKIIRRSRYAGARVERKQAAGSMQGRLVRQPVTGYSRAVLPSFAGGRTKLQ